MVQFLGQYLKKKKTTLTLILKIEKLKSASIK